VPLRPAGVQPVEHADPVARLRAASSGMDREERGRRVVLTAEKLKDLQLTVLPVQRFPIASKLRFQGFIFLLHGEPPDLREVIDVRAQLHPRVEPPFEALQARECSSSPFLVLPEVRLRGLRLYFPDFLLQ
jgi:hypothetical protein